MLLLFEIVLFIGQNNLQSLTAESINCLGLPKINLFLVLASPLRITPMLNTILHLGIKLVIWPTAIDLIDF